MGEKNTNNPSADFPQHHSQTEKRTGSAGRNRTCDGEFMRLTIYH